MDGRVALALEGHWWNVFRGLQRWRDPLFFYPTRNALGYDDCYFRSVPSMRSSTLPALAYGVRLALGLVNAAAEPFMLDGWSGQEAEGRWTEDGSATIGFPVEPPERGLRLELDAAAFAAHGRASPVPVAVDGETVAGRQPGAALQTRSVAVPARLIRADGAVRVTLAISDPVSPAEAAVGADSRKLGLFVGALRLRTD